MATMEPFDPDWVNPLDKVTLPEGLRDPCNGAFVVDVDTGELALKDIRLVKPIFEQVLEGPHKDYYFANDCCSSDTHAGVPCEGHDRPHPLEGSWYMREIQVGQDPWIQGISESTVWVGIQVIQTILTIDPTDLVCNYDMWRRVQATIFDSCDTHTIRRMPRYYLPILAGFLFRMIQHPELNANDLLKLLTTIDFIFEGAVGDLPSNVLHRGASRGSFNVVLNKRPDLPSVNNVCDGCRTSDELAKVADVAHPNTGRKTLLAEMWDVAIPMSYLYSMIFRCTLSTTKNGLDTSVSQIHHICDYMVGFMKQRLLLSDSDWFYKHVLEKLLTDSDNLQRYNFYNRNPYAAMIGLVHSQHNDIAIEALNSGFILKTWTSVPNITPGYWDGMHFKLLDRAIWNGLYSGRPAHHNLLPFLSPFGYYLMRLLGVPAVKCTATSFKRDRFPAGILSVTSEEFGSEMTTSLLASVLIYAMMPRRVAVARDANADELLLFEVQQRVSHNVWSMLEKIRDTLLPYISANAQGSYTSTVGYFIACLTQTYADRVTLERSGVGVVRSTVSRYTRGTPSCHSLCSEPVDMPFAYCMRLTEEEDLRFISIIMPMIQQGIWSQVGTTAGYYENAMRILFGLRPDLLFPSHCTNMLTGLKNVTDANRMNFYQRQGCIFSQQMLLRLPSMVSSFGDMLLDKHFDLHDLPKSTSSISFFGFMFSTIGIFNLDDDMFDDIIGDDVELGAICERLTAKFTAPDDRSDSQKNLLRPKGRCSARTVDDYFGQHSPMGLCLRISSGLSSNITRRGYEDVLYREIEFTTEELERLSAATGAPIPTDIFDIKVVEKKASKKTETELYTSRIETELPISELVATPEAIELAGLPMDKLLQLSNFKKVLWARYQTWYQLVDMAHLVFERMLKLLEALIEVDKWEEGTSTMEREFVSRVMATVRIMAMNCDDANLERMTNTYINWLKKCPVEVMKIAAKPAGILTEANPELAGMLIWKSVVSPYADEVAEAIAKSANHAPEYPDDFPSVLKDYQSDWITAKRTSSHGASKLPISENFALYVACHVIRRGDGITQSLITELEHIALDAVNTAEKKRFKLGIKLMRRAIEGLCVTYNNDTGLLSKKLMEKARSEPGGKGLLRLRIETVIFWGIPWSYYTDRYPEQRMITYRHPKSEHIYLAMMLVERLNALWFTQLSSALAISMPNDITNVPQKVTEIMNMVLDEIKLRGLIENTPEAKMLKPVHEFLTVLVSRAGMIPTASFENLRNRVNGKGTSLISALGKEEQLAILKDGQMANKEWPLERRLTVTQCEHMESVLPNLIGRWTVISPNSGCTTAPVLAKRHNHTLRMMTKAMNIFLKSTTNGAEVMNFDAEERAKDLSLLLRQRLNNEPEPICRYANGLWTQPIEEYPALLALFSVELCTSLTVPDRSTGQWVRTEDTRMLSGVDVDEQPWKIARMRGPEEIRHINRWAVLVWCINEYGLPKSDYQIQGTLFGSMTTVRGVYSSATSWLTDHTDCDDTPRRWWSEQAGLVLARSIAGKTLQPFLGKYTLFSEIFMELAMSYESEIREMAVDILMIRSSYNFGDGNYIICKALKQLLPENLYHIHGPAPVAASRSAASSIAPATEVDTSVTIDRSAMPELFDSNDLGSSMQVLPMVDVTSDSEAQPVHTDTKDPSQDSLVSTGTPLVIPEIVLGRQATIKNEVSKESSSADIVSLANVNLSLNVEAAKDKERKIIDAESSRIMGAVEMLVIQGHLRRILCDPLLTLLLTSSISFILRSRHIHSHVADSVMYLANNLIKNRSTGFIQTARRSREQLKLKDHAMVRIHGMNLSEHPLLWDCDPETTLNNHALFRERYVKQVITYRTSQWSMFPESNNPATTYEALNTATFRQTLFDSSLLAAMFSPYPMPMPISDKAKNCQDGFRYFDEMLLPEDTDASTRVDVGSYVAREDYMRALWRAHKIDGDINRVENDCMTVIKQMTTGLIAELSYAPRSTIHSDITCASLAYSMYTYSTIEHCRTLCHKWQYWSEYLSMKSLSQFMDRTIINFHDGYRTQYGASAKSSYPRSCYSMVGDMLKVDGTFSATVSSKGSGQLILQNVAYLTMMFITYQVVEATYKDQFREPQRAEALKMMNLQVHEYPEALSEFIRSDKCPGWVATVLLKLGEWVEKPKSDEDVQVAFYEVIAALLRTLTFDHNEDLFGWTMLALKPLLERQQKRISIDMHFAWENAVRWVVQFEHPRGICNHPWTGPGFNRDRNEETVSQRSQSCIHRLRRVFDALVPQLALDACGDLENSNVTDIEEQQPSETEDDVEMEVPGVDGMPMPSKKRPANTLILNKRWSVIVNLMRESPLFMFKHVFNMLPQLFEGLDGPAKDIYSYTVSYILEYCTLYGSNKDDQSHDEEMKYLKLCEESIMKYVQEQIPYLCELLDQDVSVVAKVGNKPLHIRRTEGMQSLLGLLYWLQTVRHGNLDSLLPLTFRFAFSCIRHPDKVVEHLGRRLLTYIGMSPSNFQFERANEFKSHTELGVAHLKDGLLDCLLVEARANYHPSDPNYDLTVDAEKREYKRRWAAVHLADILQGNYRIALTGTADRGKMLKIMISHLMDPHSEVRSMAQGALGNSICALNLAECIRLRNAFVSIAGEPFTCHERDISRVRAGVWGIKAMVEAFPATLPSWMPRTIVSLSEYGNSKAPDSIKHIVQDTLQNFMATHQDGWNQIFKRQFTEKQLESITTYKGIPVYFS